MDVRRIGGVIGAVVDGASLVDLDARGFAAVEDALYEHGVLFFPGQHLGQEDHRAVAARFGEPSIYPMSRLAGATTAEPQTIVDDADSPPTTDDWHTDVTWIAEPPKIAVLCGIEIPAYGGDTAFSSAVDVYESLSPPVRSLLDGLEVEHSCWPHFCETAERKSGIEGLGRAIADAYPPVRHPLIRTHPVTGVRAYYDGGATMGVPEGLTASEWAPLRDMLRAMFDEPRRQVRWRWSPGDVAVWDERLVVHRGVGDHYPQRRVVRRMTVDGERPFFAAA